MTSNDVPKMVQLNLTEEEAFYLTAYFKLGMAAAAQDVNKQAKLCLIILLYRDPSVCNQSIRALDLKLTTMARSMAEQLGGCHPERAAELDEQFNQIIDALKGR